MGPLEIRVALAIVGGGVLTGRGAEHVTLASDQDQDPRRDRQDVQQDPERRDQGHWPTRPIRINQIPRSSMPRFFVKATVILRLSRPRPSF